MSIRSDDAALASFRRDLEALSYKMRDWALDIALTDAAAGMGTRSENELVTWNRINSFVSECISGELVSLEENHEHLFTRQPELIDSLRLMARASYKSTQKDVMRSMDSLEVRLGALKANASRRRAANSIENESERAVLQLALDHEHFQLMGEKTKDDDLQHKLPTAIREFYAHLDRWDSNSFFEITRCTGNPNYRLLLSLLERTVTNSITSFDVRRVVVSIVLRLSSDALMSDLGSSGVENVYASILDIACVTVSIDSVILDASLTRTDFKAKTAPLFKQLLLHMITAKHALSHTGVEIGPILQERWLERRNGDRRYFKVLAEGGGRRDEMRRRYESAARYKHASKSVHLNLQARARSLFMHARHFWWRRIEPTFFYAMAAVIIGLGLFVVAAFAVVWELVVQPFLGTLFSQTPKVLTTWADAPSVRLASLTHISARVWATFLHDFVWVIVLMLLASLFGFGTHKRRN